VDETTSPVRITSIDDDMLINRGEGITYYSLPSEELGVEVVHLQFAPRAACRNRDSHGGASIAWVLRGEFS
jgi:hypothetical protein